MRVPFKLFAALAMLIFALALGACGGDDDGGGGNGASAGQEETGSTEGVPVIDPSAMEGAEGTIQHCAGKDLSGDMTETVKLFNKQDNGVKVEFLQLPSDSSQQRQQYIQRLRAKAKECDTFETDVVWTAEFANQKWLTDLTPYIESRKDEFIPSTLETATFDGKIFGSPRQSDAGFLYYRTDVFDKQPATWQEAYEMAKSADPKGIVYQGASYEGLTVDFLELAFAAGGNVISDDGTKSEIDSPENLEALQFMVDGIKQGAAPKAVTTYMEEEARRAFEAGRASMMRNWPYAYSLGQKSDVGGKFEVMPYPEFEGGGKAGILGGWNMVVNAYTDNPGGALKFLDYATSEERMKVYAAEYSKAPTTKATYDDPAVKKAFPFAEELLQAIEQAKSRPVTPVYGIVSAAIYENVNAALSGSMSPEDALKKADDEINKALATF